MTKFKLLSSIFCMLLGTPALFSQETKAVQGYIYDTNNSPLLNVNVFLGNLETRTDQFGFFSFSSVPTGKYAVTISALGYTTLQDSIEKKSGQETKVKFTLISRSNQLDEVLIEGQSHQKQKLQPVKTTLIDIRAAATQATSLTELMNRAPGIRIRESGGTGNRPEVSINGFQGKAIKYFKDGIPLDYLGDGYSIATMPLEAIDHIEVYKGVLPISLGADALGGAINLVPLKPRGTQANAYYEIGSFNSHKLGFRGTTESKNKKWVFGTELFYNYAKNNYKATVEVADPETKNLVAARLPLFHNASENLYAETYTQLQKTTWADELRLTLSAFQLSRQHQHPAMMTDAYGAVRSKQYTVVPSMRYKKSFLDDRIHVDQFLSYNNLQTERIDTLRGSYDWEGSFTPKNSPGESRLPSLSHINERQAISRTNLSYRVDQHTQLGLNYVFTQVTRQGHDPYGPTMDETGRDVLAIKSTYRKQVLGISLDHYWLEEKIQNQLMVKHYRYHASGIQNTWFSTAVGQKDNRKISDQYWSLAEAIRYKFSSSSLARIGAEYTYRLPEREELFGNNIFIVPNFELKPEKSMNFTLGYQLQLFSALNIEANGFYRRTHGQILLVPIQSPNAQYQNQENVKGYGFDVDANYSLSKKYRVNANATWQNLRLHGITNETDRWKNDARLRNTPYFFANMGVQGDYQRLLNSQDKLTVFLNYNFMREFYLETIPKSWEPDGFLGLSGSSQVNSNLIIPNQHLLSSGLTYKPSLRGITIGAEIRNVLDKNLYDYYRIQRPGRSFYLKVSYQIP